MSFDSAEATHEENQGYDNKRFMPPELAALHISPDSRLLEAVYDYELSEQTDIYFSSRQELNTGFMLSPGGRGVICCLANNQNSAFLKQDISEPARKLGLQIDSDLEKDVQYYSLGTIRVGKRVFSLMEDEGKIYAFHKECPLIYCGKFIHQVPEILRAELKNGFRNAGSDDGELYVV